MKKIINKNTMLGLIVGIIISGVSVYAITYEAKDISFTPKNNEWKKEGITDVNEALNYLYNNKFGSLTFMDVFHSESMGARIAHRQTMLELSKGKYIVLVMKNRGFSTDSNESTSNLLSNVDLLSNDSDLSIVQITSRDFKTSATTKWNNYYSTSSVITSLYYVEVFSNVVTIYSEINEIADSNIAQGVSIQAIKINN